MLLRKAKKDLRLKLTVKLDAQQLTIVLSVGLVRSPKTRQSRIKTPKVPRLVRESILQSKIPNRKSKIENLKSIDGGPHLRLRLKVRGCLLVEEAARVAQKSSCTAQSCW